MDTDEFDSIMEQYDDLMKAGAEEYLMAQAANMTETLLLDSAELVPIMAMNPLLGQPFLATIGVVGLKIIDGDEYQVGVSWFPHGNIPRELVQMWKNEQTTDADVVAYLLRKRLAIIAMDEDTMDADEIGWTTLLKEVNVGKRMTNFEEAVAGSSEEAEELVKSMLEATGSDFNELIKSLMEAVAEAEFQIPLEVEIDEEAEEFGQSFIAKWE